MADPNTPDTTPTVDPAANAPAVAPSIAHGVAWHYAQRLNALVEKNYAPRAAKPVIERQLRKLRQNEFLNLGFLDPDTPQRYFPRLAVNSIPETVGQ